jgi:hypothetical protein
VKWAAPGAHPGVTVAARSCAERWKSPASGFAICFATSASPMKGRNTTIRPPRTGMTVNTTASGTFTKWSAEPPGSRSPSCRTGTISQLALER